VSAGKGEHLIQPILDELTNMEEDNRLWTISSESNSFEPLEIQSPKGLLESNSENLRAGELSAVGIPMNDACRAILKAFKAAAEREITVGDGVELWIISSSDSPLRSDGLIGDFDLSSTKNGLLNTDEKTFNEVPQGAASKDDLEMVDIERSTNALNNHDSSSTLLYEAASTINSRMPLRPDRSKSPFYISKHYFALPKH
jgi:hypothetical protein